MSYSNKQNINILIALLVAHNIKHAVVCPGSRNAPIVHNLNECPNITCYPVTDERSAGFYALGISQIIHEPVVVCVTSGTALLNVVPAVAEAYYQHMPLIVISGDRPEMWIDQQAGQTLPQSHALATFVSKEVSLLEPSNEDEQWYCNRLVNEALISCKSKNGSPIHINVPITEPLFTFDVPSLPKQRTIQLYESTVSCEGIQKIKKTFVASQRPLIIIGQQPYHAAISIQQALQPLQQSIVILGECLSMSSPYYIDKVLQYFADDEEAIIPDTIIYIGGTLISKKIKQFLRRCTHAVSYIINPQGQLYDTFKNLRGIIEGNSVNVLQHLSHNGMQNMGTFDVDYYQRWQNTRRQIAQKIQNMMVSYSQLFAIKILFQHLSTQTNYLLHASNSMAIRLVNIFARTYVYCNRGVNGIEGSLSTAAGSSLVTKKDVYCVIGDLSFFYDQNALWHQLHSNFKVLLLNNGGGGIFQSLPGLQESPALPQYIAAQHHTTAQGICQQNKVSYLSAHNEEELQEGMTLFTHHHFDTPVVFEVFTQQAQDNEAMNIYHQI